MDEFLRNMKGIVCKKSWHWKLVCRGDRNRAFKAECNRRVFGIVVLLVASRGFVRALPHLAATDRNPTLTMACVDICPSRTLGLSAQRPGTPAACARCRTSSGTRTAARNRIGRTRITLVLEPERRRSRLRRRFPRRWRVRQQPLERSALYIRTPSRRRRGRKRRKEQADDFHAAGHGQMA